MATTYLTRTKGTATNDKIGTFSVWLKRGEIGANRGLWQTYASGSDRCVLYWGAADTLGLYGLGGTSGVSVATTRVFRDVSAWYHIVVAIDTTQATPSNRVKMYVNGVQETSFSATSYPAEDGVLKMLSSSTVEEIARDGGNSTQNFSGSFSHLHRIDGTAYPASTFGSTDATTGEWKINTSPTVTYGSQGFFILKDGNSVTDQSGNGNNFTVAGGTLTNTEDCPSDVFATMNPLVPDTDMSFINGNNTQQRTSATWDYSVSTLGANTGKYYFEGKIGGTGHWILGATDEIDGQGELGSGTGDVGWRNTGGLKVSNSEVGYGGGITYTSSDVICVAMDKTNNKIYFRKNGDAWINSGDPTSGATGTGAFALTNTTNTYFFGVCSYITSGTGTWDINFGNGYFGTSAIASEGTNASGIGKFEYDVPTGYTALSTKGLQE